MPVVVGVMPRGTAGRRRHLRSTSHCPATARDTVAVLCCAVMRSRRRLKDSLRLKGRVSCAVLCCAVLCCAVLCCDVM